MGPPAENGASIPADQDQVAPMESSVWPNRAAADPETGDYADAGDHAPGRDPLEHPSMAQRSGLHNTVYLAGLRIQPHRTETFKLSLHRESRTLWGCT